MTNRNRLTTMIEAPPEPSQPNRDERGIGGIFEELKNNLSGVLGGTFALLRQELNENAEQAGKALRAALGGAVFLTIGALFLTTSLNLLAIDLLAPQYLSTESAAWICTFVTGIILLVGGYVFTKRNVKKIDADTLFPSRTLESLENSFEWASDKAEETFQK